MNEEWKSVTGYENLYWVSNTGKIKNQHDRLITFKKPTTNCQYQRVSLSRDGLRKRYLIHRLVLAAFKSHLNMDKLQVNHIDNDPKNNNLINLEWCDQVTNMSLRRLTVWVSEDEIEVHYPNGATRRFKAV